MPSTAFPTLPRDLCQLVTRSAQETCALRAVRTGLGLPVSSTPGMVLSAAVTDAPLASRLTMTLDQIEQLSAARSQREGGQRLGTADSSPWQVGAPAVHHGMGTQGELWAHTES